jgi:hypothetical protein
LSFPRFCGRSSKKDGSMLFKLGAAALVVSLPVSAIATTPGARPGDDDMTCAMIGQELQPGATALSGAMAPDAGRVSQRASKLAREGKAEMARQSAISASCVAGSIATMGIADPCAAVMAAQEAEERARAPQRAADAAAMTGDINAMMANMSRSLGGMDQARMQRLMALAEAKNCH